MVEKITYVEVGEILVAGSDYALEVTIKIDGVAQDVSNRTSLQVTIMREGGTAELIADHELTLSPTPASGIVTITLTDTQTQGLDKPEIGAHNQTVDHVGTVKYVSSTGAVSFHGPYKFPVARAVGDAS